MRSAAFALVVAVPAAVLTVAVADAGAGAARQGPPPPPGGGPVTVQAADVTRKAGPAASPTTSHRGTRLRADDAATPRAPGTAPAMSASSPLTAAQDGPGHAVAAPCGARAPPVTA